MRSRSLGGFHAVVAVVAGLILSAAFPNPSPLAAQTAQERGGELSREEMQMRIIRGFEHRLMRELGMSRDQLEQIQVILHENRTARGELIRDRRTLSREMTSFAEQGGSDAEAGRLLARQSELRSREVLLQQEEEAALLEVISSSDLIRFQKLRDDLVERIRELERRRGGPAAERHSQQDRSSSIDAMLSIGYH